MKCELCGAGVWTPVESVKVQGVEMSLCQSCSTTLVPLEVEVEARRLEVRRHNNKTWPERISAASPFLGGAVFLAVGAGVYLLSGSAFVALMFAVFYGTITVSCGAGTEMHLIAAEPKPHKLIESQKPEPVPHPSMPHPTRPPPHTLTIPEIQDTIRDEEAKILARVEIDADVMAKEVFNRMMASRAAELYALAGALQVARGWRSAMEVHPYDVKGRYLGPSPVVDGRRRTTGPR